jgi:hypothetical protein
LNEFLLFSSHDPGRPSIIPRYLGQAVVRGIPVDQWETCLVDRKQYRTERRLWSFAQKGVKTPFGVVNDLAFPVHALINASIALPNGTQIDEFDDIFNIVSYKPGVLATSNMLAPPKGVFCSNTEGSQNLITPSEVGVFWPLRFSVRIDVSTSRSSTLQTFQFRLHTTEERKRMRYDYLPVGAEDFRTVIVDYTDGLIYSLDRQSGLCEITRGTNFSDVNPIVKPIEFFIKYQDSLISNLPKNAWEFNGYRSKRFDGSSGGDHACHFSQFQVAVGREFNVLFSLLLPIIFHRSSNQIRANRLENRGRR